MSEWKTYKLGEIAEINPKVPIKQGNTYSFVEMKDLDTTLKYVSPSTQKKFKGGSKFINNDTLFARITPCLENGKICQVKDLDNSIGFGSTEFIVFRGKEGVSDSDYIFYLTRTDYVRNNAIQMMTGTSGRQRVEKSALEELEILAPDLPTQTAIARILTSLDDKIELNLQMNQTLETMAQAIFKEWFVNFNFPGFDGELVDGLPKGWRKGSLYDLIDVTYGYPFRSSLFNLERIGKGLIRIRDLKNNSCGFFTEENVSDKYLVNAGDIIAGMDAEFNPSIWLGMQSWLNQRLCKFSPKNSFVSELFIYFTIQPLLERSQYGKVGTTVIHLGKSDIDGYEILIPTEIILDKYKQTSQNILSRIILNQFQNQTLTQLRDLLLPKLINGTLIINP